MNKQRTDGKTILRLAIWLSLAHLSGWLWGRFPNIFWPIITELTVSYVKLILFIWSGLGLVACGYWLSSLYARRHYRTVVISAAEIRKREMAEENPATRIVNTEILNYARELAAPWQTVENLDDVGPAERSTLSKDFETIVMALKDSGVDPHNLVTHAELNLIRVAAILCLALEQRTGIDFPKVREFRQGLRWLLYARWEAPMLKAPKAEDLLPPLDILNLIKTLALSNEVAGEIIEKVRDDIFAYKASRLYPSPPR